MTLEASFADLREKLTHLQQAVEDNLLWAVVQGQPTAEGGHALVDRYDAAVNDLIGMIKEAKETAIRGHQATKGQSNLVETHQALTICQTCFNQVSDRFYSELFSLEWTDELKTVAGEMGGEWAIWEQGVRDALNQCPQPLRNVGRALSDCWNDLNERAGLLFRPT